MIQRLQTFLWSPVMLAAFFAIGLSYTVHLRFFPLFHMKFWLSATLGSLFHRRGKSSSGKISAFEAMSTALAGSMGIGNIAGVASALVAGGPGAIFWMWISSIFGMMTKYAEIVLGYRYRHRNTKGEWYGGPMYYMKEGLHSPLLASIFATDQRRLHVRGVHRPHGRQRLGGSRGPIRIGPYGGWKQQSGCGAQGLCHPHSSEQPLLSVQGCPL